MGKQEAMNTSEIKEFTGVERVGIFFFNWILLLFAPLWAPIAFWHYAVTGKGFIQKLLSGKGYIGK